MSAAHTPGPWKICGNEPDAWRVGNIISLVTYDTVAYAASGTNSGSTVQKDSELEANARLIAAAPDLLEALQSLCARHRASLYPAEYEQAFAAISKATTDIEPNSVGTPQGVNQK